MPYCCQCGKSVAPTDGFCAHCGTRQASARPPAAEFLSGMSPRTASLLCYIPVVGWIPAIVVLASQRFRDNRDVRFHAFQGLYIFVAWLVVNWALAPIPFLGFGGFGPLHLGIRGILKGLLLFTWIFMLIKTSQNQTYRLPIFGDLADRSLTEQK
jgi:uncharacterized membrane protein